MFYFLPTLLKIVKEGYFCTILKKDYLALKKRISFQKGRARKKKLFKSNTLAGFYDNFG